MKVLIADDDGDQLSIREMLLTKAGFEAIAVCDGASALSAAESENPACAILDVRLPDEQSGLQLIRDLKLRHPDMRIIILTGMNVARLNGLPERALIDEVIQKGSPSAGLIGKLEQMRRVSPQPM